MRPISHATGARVEQHPGSTSGVENAAGHVVVIAVAVGPRHESGAAQGGQPTAVDGTAPSRQDGGANAAPWVEFFGATEFRALTSMTHLALSAIPGEPSQPSALDRAKASLRDTVSNRGADTARSRAFDLTAPVTVALWAGDAGAGIDPGRQAPTLAEQLRSVRVVDRLAPLALEASRVDSADAKDLAVDIEQLASTSPAGPDRPAGRPCLPRTTRARWSPSRSSRSSRASRRGSGSTPPAHGG